MSMDLDALKTELLAGHPDTGDYSVDDVLATAELNAVNRTTDKERVSGSEILQAIDTAEFAALAADDKQTIWDVLHLGSINPFGVEAALFTGAFGGGSVTITALAALRKNDVSRSVELGWGVAALGHVQMARGI